MTSKDVLIFFSFREHKTGYYNTLFNPLKAVEQQYGVTLHRGSLKDLHIEIIDNSLYVTEALTGRPLDDFAYVRFELWLKSPQQALAAATYLERKHVAFSGHEATQVLCSTKIGEMVRMSDQGLPLPRTFMSSYRETLRMFKQQPPIAYPCVAKAADAFGGHMNYLVHDYAELKAALAAHREQFFVIQEYIPNDCDYRCLVMGGHIKLVLKRSRGADNTTHLNNTSAGAQGTFVPVSDLPEAVRRDALAAARATLRSDYAGIDVMTDKITGRHYILEVNEAPAIQTGEQPDVKIDTLMQYIHDVAYGART